MRIIDAHEIRSEARYHINRIAAHLLTQEDALGVQIFGSYARGEDTPASDCDIIVVACTATANLWVRDSYGEFGEGGSYLDGRQRRWEVFGRYFSLPGAADDWNFYDVFVFPANWREAKVLAQLQELGRHHDAGFMQNIANDAIEYDPLVESFPWKD